MLGKMALNLLAKIFEMSLCVVLHRLIGQNFVIFVGLFVFGMREILVLLISVMGRLEFSTFNTMFVIFDPTMSHYL